MFIRLVYNKNLLINGDAEIGSCDITGLGLVSPTGWTYFGGITQISYITIQTQNYLTPGPR